MGSDINVTHKGTYMSGNMPHRSHIRYDTVYLCALKNWRASKTAPKTKTKEKLKTKTEQLRRNASGDNP